MDREFLDRKMGRNGGDRARRLGGQIGGFGILHKALWLGLVAGLLVIGGGSDKAKAANWLEKNFYLSGPHYDGDLPACNAASALSAITSNFHTRESRFWNSSLEITGYDRIREVAFRPWAPDTIPRRFCEARAYVTDGKWRSVYYYIGEDTGEIGASWGVQWCVMGLDRNWAYNPSCQMARP
jgi:hypothetical protein